MDFYATRNPSCDMIIYTRSRLPSPPLPEPLAIFNCLGARLYVIPAPRNLTYLPLFYFSVYVSFLLLLLLHCVVSLSVVALLALCLLQRSGKTYGPPSSKRLVYFIDDLNMPFVEEYGTQTPIALLRQYMDYRGCVEVYAYATPLTTPPKACLAE